MYAIRQIQQVREDRTITVHLPPDFPADRIEVIVLPAEEPSGREEPLDPAVRNFLEMDMSQLSEEQREAHARVVAYLQQEHDPDEPRVFGLFRGWIEVAEDFDAPLPPEIEDLFWGSETDEYGMSIDQ